MRFFLISLFILLNTIRLDAQHFELGVNVGGTNYLGDLTPSGLWTSIGETHLSAGAFVRYNILGWVAIKGGVNYGQIAASDKNANAKSARVYRNLSFRSNIYEVALTAEINILRYEAYNLRRPFSPYIFGGIAIFKFNPQTQYDGKWYDLQPLGTEGQGLSGYSEKYNLTQFSIPLGFGIKFTKNDKWNFGFEFGMRKTFTDYLDDVSKYYPDLEELAHVNGQIAAELSWRTDEIIPGADPPGTGSGRGDLTDLDWYIFTGFTFSYNLFGNHYIETRRKKAKVKCAYF
jgi:Domain of unknown function (DUF6089)